MKITIFSRRGPNDGTIPTYRFPYSYSRSCTKMYLDYRSSSVYGSARDEDACLST